MIYAYVIHRHSNPGSQVKQIQIITGYIKKNVEAEFNEDRQYIERHRLSEKVVPINMSKSAFINKVIRAYYKDGKYKSATRQKSSRFEETTYYVINYTED